MTEKCITLDNILYKSKHHRVNKIIFVDEKDVKRMEDQGAIRRLEKSKSKPKIKRILHPVIKIRAEKIKKYTYKAKKEKEIIESIKRPIESVKKPIKSVKTPIEFVKKPIESIKDPIKSKRRRGKYAHTKAKR